MGATIALVIGGPIAGWILKFNWLGKPGWRWVFILEAVPAIVLGIVTFFIMTDRPEHATWLEPEEREWVCNELEIERRQKASLRKLAFWQVLRQRNVLILALMTFLFNIGIAGFFLWLPTTVQKASGLPPYLSAAVSALPFVAAIAAQLSFSWSSDRTGERYLHTAVPLIMAGLIFRERYVKHRCYLGAGAGGWPGAVEFC
jgi:ACS family tartrate transporter-like MFS transporter